MLYMKKKLHESHQCIYKGQTRILTRNDQSVLAAHADEAAAHDHTQQGETTSSPRYYGDECLLGNGEGPGLVDALGGTTRRQVAASPIVVVKSEGVVEVGEAAAELIVCTSAFVGNRRRKEANGGFAGGVKSCRGQNTARSGEKRTAKLSAGRAAVSLQVCGV